MNQFKKAKQNSHQTESITDLKTAGITTTAPKTPSSKSEEPIPVKTEPADITTNEAEISENMIVSDNVPAYQVENTSHAVITDYETVSVQPQIVATPVAQPQYREYTETYSAPVSTKTVKNGKKSAPNMFTQKSESKSIRKSLVLRPSSVRIAENYCAKNGGSFNELIQILLDNFIDEYGL